METCGNCKWWKSIDTKTYECYGHLYPRSENPFGPCGRIQHDSEDNVGDLMMDRKREHDVDVKNETAVVQDGSGYYAALLSREDFGCNLWEPK